MKFKIKTASYRPNNERPCLNCYFENEDWYIDINSIYDLTTLIAVCGHDIIVAPSQWNVSDYDITIYDGYVE
jgi:hypothetical protein